MNENDTSVTHGGGVEAQPRKMLSVKNLDLNDSADCQRADKYCWLDRYNATVQQTIPCL